VDESGESVDPNADEAQKTAALVPGCVGTVNPTAMSHSGAKANSAVNGSALVEVLPNIF